MEKAFLDTVTSNQGIIHKVCNMYCDTYEDREDLFQEVVSQLWKSYPTFENKSKITTWMYRVALNTAITYFKKEKRRPDSESADQYNIQYADEGYDTTFDEQVKLLRKAIDKLTGVEKSIVLLYLEDKNYEEISDIVGITQNYVRVKMNRIKKKLKKLMSPVEEWN